MLKKLKQLGLSTISANDDVQEIQEQLRTRKNIDEFLKLPTMTIKQGLCEIFKLK